MTKCNELRIDAGYSSNPQDFIASSTHGSSNGIIAATHGSNNGNDERLEVLIVGFGFAAIPLLRLLRESNIKYTILSEGKTIWQRLHEKDKLDFNLVSSFHASYYAQDQVDDGRLQDFFPCAREFYEYQQNIFREFQHEVVQDRVVSIENLFDNHDNNNYSIVKTKLGGTYRAKHVVVATGFSRPQNETIVDFEYDSIKNKTVVLNGFGDTANLMLSKLAPNGNKCIIVSNGFIALEKDMCFQHFAPIKALDGYSLPLAGGTFGLKYLSDLAQMESHTMGVYFPKFWGRFMAMVSGPPGPDSWFGRLFYSDFFPIKFPSTWRRDVALSIFRSPLRRCRSGGGSSSGAGWPHGVMGIKYHAIDSYKIRYGYNRQVLKDNIRQGHLLNDFPFFHTQGLVETWKRNTTSIDRENQTISSTMNENGNDATTPSSSTILSYDHIIDAQGVETPNIPPIYSISSNSNCTTTTKHRYQYKYRENLYGVIPSRLNNIFFMGLTRPFSGGVANMNEMQAMLIHDLITNPEKKEEMYSTIHERLSQYNNRFYTCDEPDEAGRMDHVIFYGLYTHEVAKFLEIETPILRTLFSLSWNPWKILTNLRFELLCPNNSIKYRMFGKYALKGVSEYIRKVYDFNEGYAIVFAAYMNVLLDRLLGYLCIFMLHLELSSWLMQDAFKEDYYHRLVVSYIIPLPMSLLLSNFLEDNVHNINLLYLNIGSCAFSGVKIYLQVPAMVYAAFYGRWYWCFGICFSFCIIVYLLRQFHYSPYSSRYVFGDCRYKYLYRPFWDQYLEVYHEVYKERQSLKKKMKE